MDELQTKLAMWATERLGVTLTARQCEQFETYYRLLVEWNEKMNLTGITGREQVYEKHFFDSLTVTAAADLSMAERLADIGSGAGFPSLPLKVAFPHLQVTIVDALAKRIRFLEEVAAALGLKDVTALHGRAEEVSRNPEHRDGYDLVTARAVAKLSVLNEFCLPFTRPGGLFVAMKGSDVEEELRESLYSASELNGSVREVRKLELPVEQSVRHLVIIEKKGVTPKAYPRKAGLPLKLPLVEG